MLKGEPILVLLFVALVAQGVVYWAYNNFREICVMDAVAGARFEPARMFLSTYVFGVVYWLISLTAAAMLGCVLFPLFLAAIPHGLSGWYGMLRDRERNRTDRELTLSNHPVPPLQFRIADLWVATFTFGILLTVLANWYFDHRNPAANAGLIVCALLVETGSFLIAMDVCRRSKVLQNPVQRSLYTMLVMLLSAVPPFFIILPVTWRAWRYAMWKAELHLALFKR
jgi:hypothetical protein